MQKTPETTSPGLLMYVTGFEPTTYWSVASRSIQLSYTYIYRFSLAGIYKMSDIILRMEGDV